ncbi:hypothetical protein PHLCEN_2v160 [Hermanssonia centrifuga]|uniref:Uncharacterized protein n=1 Tax=Hermanssonia centrifuga TaxID=98765 RepID=A0A2R6S6R6_9APHY|nr:hypothetical protein PHLCEN_2v160 [Hermanssonia centrifuga]
MPSQHDLINFRVEDILSGKSEVDKILHRAPSPEYGYVILPDMKWDLITISSLYLMAISLSSSIRSLRDLRKSHLPMLRSIRVETARIVKERWGLGEGSIRMFIHYQPSYCVYIRACPSSTIHTKYASEDHFHVHIVNANYLGLMGSTVGQAHLLDDVISLLEVDSDNIADGTSIYERLTLTYGLGDQHGLFGPLKQAQAMISAA